MRILKAILPLVILGVGAYAVVKLLETRETAARSQAPVRAALVQVMQTGPERRRVTVSAMGTVVPAKSVVVFPEVTGRIVEQHPQLVPGGIFQAGDILARIEVRDYELAVDQAEASVEQAEFELAVERGRQRVAEREWALLDQSVAGEETSRDLALRKPHQRFAEANLAAAESRLEMAKLNLSRTVISVPFNSLVREEFVDTGQLVTPQSKLATLVGTDEFWVQVTMPVDRLNFISVPRRFGEDGAVARVIHAPGPGVSTERTGRVLGLKGDLDPAGRMAEVLVGVEDPLGLRDGDRLPLLLGAYVRVEIEGKYLNRVTVLPRSALREGDRVWVMDAADRLEIRPVEIAWRSKDAVWVSDGSSPDDRIITSDLPVPVEGMRLRVEDADGTATRTDVDR